MGHPVIPRLPFLRPVVAVIAAVYLARGLLGIPAVLFLPGAYMDELQHKGTFMVVTSLVSIGLGLCYAIGAGALRQGAGRGH